MLLRPSHVVQYASPLSTRSMKVINLQVNQKHSAGAERQCTLSGPCMQVGCPFSVTVRQAHKLSLPLLSWNSLSQCSLRARNYNRCPGWIGQRTVDWTGSHFCSAGVKHLLHIRQGNELFTDRMKL